MHPDRERWNRKHAERRPVPDVRLIMHRGRLAKGRALDVAAGAGDDAALLALGGWDVTACDISDAAVSAAKARARELKARVKIVQADATQLPFREAAFDLVVCSFFHDRAVAAQLPRLLKPGGTLYYQSYTTTHLKYAPSFRREYCLEPGELKRLFSGLKELLHVEEDDGFRATGLLIGRK